MAFQPLDWAAVGGSARKRLTAASLALVAATVGSLAAPANPGAAVVSHPVGQDPEAVLDYWTPERMRGAVSLGAAAGATARRAAARPAIAPFPDQETSAGADTLYPQRVHGKLFLRKGASTVSCSATLVSARGEDAILTAAHCLFDRDLGVEATDVVFAPGYRNGATPFGRFPASALHYPDEFTEGDREFDIGAVNLAPNASGLRASALGTMGVTFNRPRRSFRRDTFQIFGYPGRPRSFYDGQRLILCVTPFTGFRDGALRADPCYQHEGSSGGAWVRDDGLITSVSSRHPSCAVDTVACTAVKIGTYLGDAAFKVWAAAADGVPKGIKKRLKRCKQIRKKANELACRNRAQTFKPIEP